MKLKSLSVRPFQNKLLAWYDANQRDLPFRANRDPYRVWLSEIMLQQTTVTSALPYFERFLQRLPGVAEVANASEEELLNLWQGLGYYSRVRNFQKACRMVMERYGGRIPQELEGLRRLPGIGDYTASAIASICFDLPFAVVDGNVKRVLARLFKFDHEDDTPAARHFFQDTAARLLARSRPGDFNQGMMELGATVCRPKPECGVCPVGGFCAARGQDPQRLPRKKRLNYRLVRYSALLMKDDSQVVLKRPDSSSLISGMWELPFVYVPHELAPSGHWGKTLGRSFDTANLSEIGQVRHAITDKRITVVVYSHPLIRPPRSVYESVSLKGLERFPINTLSRKILSAYGEAI